MHLLRAGGIYPFVAWSVLTGVGACSESGGAAMPLLGHQDYRCFTTMQQTNLALTTLVLALAAAGCSSTPSNRALAVQSADERVVASCRLLGEVFGSSGWGGLAASSGMQNARIEAQEKAAALGATHIVWLSVAGGFSPSAAGRAYRC